MGSPVCHTDVTAGVKDIFGAPATLTYALCVLGDNDLKPPDGLTEASAVLTAHWSLGLGLDLISKTYWRSG